MHSRRIASACGAICAGLLTGFAAIPASAAAEPVPLAGAGSGLSAPTGIARTPEGAIWIADPLAGVCQYSADGPTRLVSSTWCMPNRSEGLDPDLFDEFAGPADTDDGPSRVGPHEPTGIAFDTESEHLYVADGGSAGGSIWRLQLDPETGAIAESDVIATTNGRIEAMSLGPATADRSGSDVFFVTKDDELMRVADPAGEPQTPVRVARTDGGEPAGMTALGNSLYIAHGGLTRYELDPITGQASSEGVDGVGSNMTAVVADPDRDRLYTGTTTDSGADDLVKVLDVNTGRVEDYELGFVGVTALGLGAEGSLLVADDPVVATGAEGTIGEGRLWSVDLQPLNRPTVSITSRPPALSAEDSPTFRYSSRDGASFECRLDGEPFAACDGVGEGERVYENLAEGEHRFSVRARDGMTGLPKSVAFRLDRTAPEVKVVQPSGDIVEGGPAPRIRIDVNEAGVSFQCRLDDGPYRECWSGNPLEGLTAGTHTLQVVGTDGAGNRSDADAPNASIRLVVRARPRQAPQLPQVFPVSGAAPVATPAPAPAPQATDTAGPKAQLRLLSARAVGDLKSDRARLAITVRTATRGGRLKLAVRRGDGRVVLTRTVTVRKSGVTSLELRLTRAERGRLKAGRYRVTGTLTTAAGTRSDAQVRDLRIAQR